MGGGRGGGGGGGALWWVIWAGLLGRLVGRSGG